MAVSQTTRLAIYKWTAGTDTFTRDQMTTSHDNLEAKVAGYNQAGSRPTAGAAYSGFFHYSSTDSTAGTLSYCNGNSWFTIGALSAGTPTPLDGSAAAGSAVDGSRSDHKHAIANDAITNAMIADNAVQAAQINADAVTTAKILNSNVTHEKIENSVGVSVIGRSAGSAGVVADIAAGSDHEVLRRSGSTLGFGTIATEGIADDAVTAAKLDSTDGSEAVATATIQDGAVTALKLASDAVTTVKIDDDAVTYPKLAHTTAGYGILVRGASTAGPLIEANAGDGEVLRRIGTGLGFGEINADCIMDNNVTTAKLASANGSEAVTRETIRANAVGDDELDYGDIAVYGKNGSAPAGHRIYASVNAPSGTGTSGDIYLQYTT